MDLEFGKYSVRLIDETKSSAEFPLHWHDKQIRYRNPDVVLRVCEASVADTSFINDGWIVDNSCGNKRFLYLENGIVLFAEQFGSSQNTVRLIVNVKTPKNIRLGMQFSLLLALHKRCVGLHGVTLLCGNEIIILSAPSGTGKTTLAHLLEEFNDAIVINGDFALLTPTENGVIFEPTPFCGSSGRCLNHRVKVDRVVFLEQSPVNIWSDLTARETLKQFLNNSFVPDWDSDMLPAVQTNVMSCISKLKVNRFAFAPDKEAAKVFSQQINS